MRVLSVAPVRISKKLLKKVGWQVVGVRGEGGKRDSVPLEMKEVTVLQGAHAAARLVEECELFRRVKNESERWDPMWIGRGSIRWSVLAKIPGMSDLCPWINK